MGVFGTIALAAAFAAGVICLALLKLVKNREHGLKAGALSGAFVVISALVLLFLLIGGDFSVEYVYRNTDRSLPLIYRISAFWSGSGGSLLLWAACNAVIQLVAYVVARVRRQQDRSFLTCLTATMTAVNLGFLFVLVFISSPFKPIQPGSDGFGLNPSLQSIGMVFHPPLIMLSYALVFTAFASALRDGRHPESAAPRATGSIALLCWIVLTAGIASGGVWAYSELGWGGYWSWDPIENSALITWLIVTAALHMGAQKPGAFAGGRALAFVLAAASFSSLFGTFLARSGVLGSVHAYSSQAGTVFFILLLAGLAALSLGVIRAVRGKRERTGKPGDTRLIQHLPSILLLVCAAGIALMTLSPLLPPGAAPAASTYDRAFGAAGLLLLLFSAVSPLRRTPLKQKLVLVPAALVLGASAAFLPAFSQYPAFVRTALGVCVFCLAAALLNAAFGAGRPQSRRYYTLFVIHLSVIVIAIGLIGSRGMKTEISAVLHVNEALRIGNHELALTAVSVDDGPAVKTWTAALAYSDGETVRDLDTALQHYKKLDAYHSNAVILSSLKEDIYIIIENASDEGAVLLKVSQMKWISLLWIGISVMISASVILLLKKRHGTADISYWSEKGSVPCADIS